VPSIGPAELVLVFIIALVVLGPKRLPEVGRQIGRAVREFRTATSQIRSEMGVDDIAADVRDIRKTVGVDGITRDLKRDVDEAKGAFRIDTGTPGAAASPAGETQDGAGTATPAAKPAPDSTVAGAAPATSGDASLTAAVGALFSGPAAADAPAAAERPEPPAPSAPDVPTAPDAD
jgi:Tat protein translocase TatB subunit